MRELVTSLVFMLALIPVNLAVDHHPYWAGATFGVWGTSCVLAIGWYVDGR